ncbi:hypothetical protein [Kribbella sp. CA-294648]|uniref:hypothetical protein n=1 Tax=Kribbella sp. CA-294648 TaxID=3239948 RepID=UPI003D8E72BB
MNETETRLTDELNREAAAVDVDLDRMWSVVQERTKTADSEAPAARRRRHRLTPYLAAASVAAVMVTVAVVNDGDHQPAPAGQNPPAATKDTSTAPVSPDEPAGPVDRPVADWACQYRTTIQPVPGAFFDPRKAPQEAIEREVPRFHFTLSEKTGVLDYGDASGRRISRTELTRTGDRWRVGARTVCSGAGGRPSTDPVALGKYTGKPLPFDPGTAQVTDIPATGTPVLVDDRSYFDCTGMLRQTTLYAYPAKNGYTFARIPENPSYDLSVSPADQLGGDSAMVDSRGPDETNPFGAHAPTLELIVSYLTKDPDVTGLSSVSASDGRKGPVAKFAFPGGGTLYTVVAPSKIDGDTSVTVHRKSGDEPPRRY